jgi:hypothetical protein
MVAMREQLMRGRYGVMASLKAVRMPLSILVAADNRLHRYLTPVIVAARQSWLTFNMGSKNRPAWQRVCAAHDLEIVTTCCCSVIAVHHGAADALCKSDLVRLQDSVRSAADRLAAPVHLVDALADIPAVNADLTDDERELFALMDTLLKACVPVNVPMAVGDVMKSFNDLRALTTASAVGSMHH